MDAGGVVKAADKLTEALRTMVVRVEAAGYEVTSAEVATRSYQGDPAGAISVKVEAQPREEEEAASDG